ncbi:hypothetical protein D9M72_640900 [compost metagenome]
MGGDGSHQDRVAVRIGARDIGRAEIAAGAGDVLDDHLLAEVFRHFLRDDAGDHVGRPAGGEGNDQCYRSVREALGEGRGAKGQRR